jgi:ABC-type uncharacterized transport system substrate-binding protein
MPPQDKHCDFSEDQARKVPVTWTCCSFTFPPYLLTIGVAFWIPQRVLYMLAKSGRPGLKLTILALALTGAADSRAHPHVWIEARSDVVFDDQGLIVAVNHEWKMDESYSEMATDGLDADGDGLYSPQELEPLTKENIESLREYSYFTFMKSGDSAVAFGDIVEAGQLWSHKRLTLHFQMRLRDPVDPTKSRVYYRVYDPDYFISIEFPTKEAVTALGGKPAGCAVELRDPVANDETAQTKAMLASKGKEWQPPPEQDFGAMFAQPIIVSCK